MNRRPSLGSAKRPARGLRGFSYDERSRELKVVVYLPGGKGKNRRKKTFQNVSDEKEATRLYHAFLDQVLGGQPEKNVLTFGEYIDRFWPSIEGDVKISPTTATEYRRIVDNHLLPSFKLTRLCDITTAKVKELEANLKRKKYATATINGYLSVLVLLLHRAVEVFDLLDTFPMKKRLSRKRTPPLALELSDEERERFFAAFDDEAAFRRDLADRRVLGKLAASEHFNGARRFGGSTKPDSEAAGDAFCRFAYMKELFIVADRTGIRKSDLLALTFRNIDFERRVIHLIMKKTKLPVTVPMSDDCAAALEACRARTRGDRVFVDEDGQPISATRLKRTHERAKRLAGIARRHRFHDFRHGFAVRLATKDVPIQSLALLLGHTSITMASKYARPTADALTAVRSKID